nr:MAG TPA: structural protein [Caudoviricetes sp.]
MPMRFKDKIEGTITNADYAGSAGSVAWGNVTGKPSTFAPSSHTHNYAGSSSAGGSANSAVKLDTATAGSTSQPVYFANGKPVAIGYTIQSNVPANAKFTDTNTTYDVFKAATTDAAGGKGLVPAPAAGAQGKYLRADGTWSSPPNDNTTYTDFSGATADAAGTHGLVPAPAKGQQSYFLRGDKTWQALSKSSVGLGNVDNTADSAKSVKYATSAGSANSVAWGNVSGKPTTFTPASHTHKYASGFSVSGTTVTVTYGDNTTSTFQTQDTNNTYGVFKAATAEAAGGTGLVPAPAKGQQGYYLAGDSTWKAFSKSTVGLGNVDNTADSAKSVKYATSAGSAGSATSATKATNDAKDQVITGYVRGLSISGRTITITKGDGTSSTITTQDTNSTYDVFAGATADAAGGTGLVPAPAKGDQAKFLRADGTWQVPNNTWRPVQDNLTSTATDQSLSANQGKVLKGLIDGKAASSHTHNYAGSASAGGSANSAVKLDTATAGSTSQPVYFTNGKPAAIGYTILSNVPANAKFTDTNTDTKVTQSAVTAADYTNWRPLVWGSSNSTTEGFSPTTVTDGVFVASSISCQPSSGTIKATTFKGNLTGTADSANAVAWGNVSGKPSTFTPASHTHKYASGFSVSGTTVTVTYGDNTTSTFTTQDTNSTYDVFKAATASAAGGKGLVPAPASGAQGKYLRADGTWQTPPDTNTTYDVFKGATSSAAGGKGLVPAPASGAITQYLKSTGAWGAVAWGEISGKPSTFIPATHTHNYAGSASAGGSATSAVKLDTATAGSATQPVYFSGGKPVACTYTLGKSVPSNAVFTDTHTLTLADRVSGKVVTCTAIPTT